MVSERELPNDLSNVCIWQVLPWKCGLDFPRMCCPVRQILPFCPLRKCGSDFQFDMTLLAFPFQVLLKWWEGRDLGFCADEPALARACYSSVLFVDCSSHSVLSVCVNQSTESP